MIKFISKFEDNYAFLEILDSEENKDEYIVEFVDVDTNNVEYSTSININHWSRLDNMLEKNITIKVLLNNNIIFEKNRYDKYNKVYILFGSESLGDNIAWIPYAEKYRVEKNVEVLVYTKFKFLFDGVYPELIFTDIGNPDNISGVDKKFRIDYGAEFFIINDKHDPDEWYESNKKYDNEVDYASFRTVPLQSTAALTLGLSTDEIKSKVNIPDKKTNIKGKYVVVAIQSTAQLKYWNKIGGWEVLFDFLKKNGYKVIIIDKYKKFGIYGFYNEAPKGKNVIFKTGDIPLSERIKDIQGADMMITISSGLAWLSWAVGTPVVMISGFTKPWNEFKSNIARVHNDSVCNGCWNDTDISYKGFDWMSCPRNKFFECSSKITPRDVISEVKKFIK